MKQPTNNMEEVLKKSVGDAHEKPPAEVSVEASDNGSYRPPSREDTKVIMGHFDKETHTQFGYLKLETGESGQQLLCDALNFLFVHHGKPPIAKGVKK